MGLATTCRTGARPAEPLLAFRIGDRDLGLHARWVGSVFEPSAIRRVHGAPASVLGLVECAGRILTVVDLARLLDDRSAGETGAERACMIRLAPPFGHLALRVPAGVRLVHSAVPAQPGGGAEPAPDDPLGEEVRGESGPLLLLRPEALVPAIRRAVRPR